MVSNVALTAFSLSFLDRPVSVSYTHLILSISLPGYRSEVLMNFLEARGIYTSKSSACKKGGRSHVLEAIGLPANVIDGALRISFSRYTTREDIDALCDACLLYTSRCV